MIRRVRVLLDRRKRHHDALADSYVAGGHNALSAAAVNLDRVGEHQAAILVRTVQRAWDEAQREYRETHR